jgi:hypothetical protein
MHTVNVDEVTPIGAILRQGRYPGRLLTVEGSISKAKPDGKGGNPMIVATYVVTGGEAEGLEAKIWYTLTVSTKNGKKFAGGVIDAKKAFAAAGKPLPSGFAFPAIPSGDPSITEADKQRVADTAAQLYGKRLKGTDVELLVTNESPLLDPDTQEQRKDAEGNLLWRTRTTIIGAVNKAPAVAIPANVADFDFGDD